MKRMKTAAVIGMCIAACMVFSGCGSSASGEASAAGSSYGEVQAYDVVSSTHILTFEELAERDGVEYGDLSAYDEDEPDVADESETEDGGTEDAGDATPSDTEPAVEDFEYANPVTAETQSASSAADSASVPRGGYRYADFVISRAGSGNAVFSGEAFLTQLSMYGACLDEASASSLHSYVTRDYLGFSYGTGLQMVSTVWADPSVSFSSDYSALDLVRTVDASSASSAVERNRAVSQATGGYVSYVPSVLSVSSPVDFSCTAYLQSGWKGGSRPYDTKSRIFYNADGTDVHVTMVHDEGLTYWILDNAEAYCMYLEDGSYVMFVIPDEGVSLSEVDLSGLMSGRTASRRAHVNFYFPEFDVESSYLLSLSDFGLSAGTVDSGIVSGIDGLVPSFGQECRFSVTAAGVGGVSFSDEVSAGDFSSEENIVNIVCNRPFIWYAGDAVNEDVAFFGVVNHIDGVVTTDDADE